MLNILRGQHQSSTLVQQTRPCFAWCTFGRRSHCFLKTRRRQLLFWLGFRRHRRHFKDIILFYNVNFTNTETMDSAIVRVMLANTETEHFDIHRWRKEMTVSDLLGNSSTCGRGSLLFLRNGHFLLWHFLLNLRHFKDIISW